MLHIREAVYEGTFGTPKTEAGRRQIPLSDAAMQVIADWQAHVPTIEPDRLLFATRSGKPIAPNNVLRRWIFPNCAAHGLGNATWLTFRRTYSTWAHQNGVPGKIVAQVMGHAKVDTTLNVYTQVLQGPSGRPSRASARNCSIAGRDARANSLKRLARATGFEQSSLCG